MDLDTGEMQEVAGGLAFANGLALSSDERSLFVAETGEYRVLRIRLGGAGKKADKEVVVSHPHRPRCSWLRGLV